RRRTRGVDVAALDRQARRAGGDDPAEAVADEARVGERHVLARLDPDGRVAVVLRDEPLVPAARAREDEAVAAARPDREVGRVDGRAGAEDRAVRRDEPGAGERVVDDEAVER